jgi:hypothetical protein
MVSSQGMQDDGGHMYSQEYGDQPFPEFVKFFYCMQKPPGFVAWSEKKKHEGPSGCHPREDGQSKGFPQAGQPYMGGAVGGRPSFSSLKGPDTS